MQSQNFKSDLNEWSIFENYADTSVSAVVLVVVNSFTTYALLCSSIILCFVTLENHLKVKKMRFFPSFRFVIVLITLGHITALPGVGFASLNFGIVCMVNQTYLLGSQGDSNSSSACGATNKTVDNSSCSNQGIFLWTKDIEANLLAGYSYGAILLVFFAGSLVDKLGPKLVMTVSCFVVLISLVLVPVGATYGDWPAVFVLRILLGCGSAASWPVIAKVAAVWTPPHERGTAMSIPSSGFALGSFITNLISGFLCCHLGWQAVYYFVAIICAVYTVIMLIFFSSSPCSSRWISEAEKEYILSHTEARKQQATNYKIPYFAILTSLPVWAVIINGYAERTIQFYTLIFLPTYLSEALGETSVTNGIITAIPSLCQIVGRTLSGVLSDKVKFSKKNETLNLKTYNTIAFLLVMVFMVGLAFVQCGQDYLVTIYMCLQFFFGSLVLAGYMKSALVIAPRYAGTIMGLSTFGAFIAAIVVPNVVERMTPDGTLSQWRISFYFVIAVLIFGTIVFLLFGTSQLQKWAVQQTNSTEQRLNGISTVVQAPVENGVHSSGLFADKENHIGNEHLIIERF